MSLLADPQTDRRRPNRRRSRAARKSRGQFFTPVEVARAMVRIARALGGGRLPAGPVVDPACGEGAFLTAALAEGIGAARLVGVDVDRSLRRAWQAGRLIDRGVRLTVANGLAWAGPEGGAGFVIGNPPFGPRIDAERIECRFARKFLALTKPGGLVAMILPEGLLANQRTAKLRRELVSEAQILAVVGLPKGLFRGEGAAARTAVLFGRKSRSNVPRHSKSRPVLVTSSEFPGAPASLADYLDSVLDAARCHGLGRTPKAGPWVRVPADGWPGVRWDPGYWHPETLAPLAGCLHPVRLLGEFIESITYGPIVTRERADPRALGWKGGVTLIGQSQFTATGLDLSGAEQVRPGSVYDPPRCRIQEGDLLLPRSGTGSLGKYRLALYDGTAPATVSCFVNRIRLRGIRPHYVAAFLRSRPGRQQIRRAANGVGTLNISFDQIKALRVAVPPAALQRKIERHALRAQRVHMAALQERDSRAWRRALQALAELIRQTELEILGDLARETPNGRLASFAPECDDSGI